MRAPYSTVDLLALRIAPEQICAVVENQQMGDTHVKVLRAGQTTPELIRNEDLILLSQREAILTSSPG